MTTVWVIIKDGKVYGVAKNNITVYDMLNDFINANYSGVPQAIARNLLKSGFEKFGTKMSIGNGIYAEEWAISE